MSLISKLVKTGVANKVIAEARKPENQAKAKAQASKLQQKYKTWKASKNNRS